MTELDYPPFMPDELKKPRQRWVGENPFNPQLKVVDGPSKIDLIKAFQERTVVNFALESSSADMDEREINNEGSIQVTITYLIQDPNEGLHFLARGGNIPYSDGTIWIWCYENGWGGADVPTD